MRTKRGREKEDDVSYTRWVGRKREEERGRAPCKDAVARTYSRSGKCWGCKEGRKSMESGGICRCNGMGVDVDAIFVDKFYLILVYQE